MEFDQSNHWVVVRGNKILGTCMSKASLIKNINRGVYPNGKIMTLGEFLLAKDVK